MTPEEVLIELKKLMGRWGLSVDDWAIMLHYSDMLQGYEKLKYQRDEHLHIIIAYGKTPWRAKEDESYDEIEIPHNSRFYASFCDFIGSTSYDFHIINSIFDKKIELFKKFGIDYKLGNEKIKVITPVGNLHFVELAASRWKGIVSEEIINRRLKWTELIREEAERKGDTEVARKAADIVNKYKPEDDELSKTANILMEDFEKDGFFKGDAAFKGIAKGKVFRIDNPDRPPGIKEGRILVSKLAGPKLIPYIKKSKAVITDEGGMLSHAAIYCGESKIPCIVGTKIATKALKEDDFVEVNANDRIVRLIKRSN